MEGLTIVPFHKLSEVLHSMFIDSNIIQSQLLEDGEEIFDGEEGEQNTIVIPNEFIIGPHEELTFGNLKTFIKCFTYFGFSHEARRFLLRFLVDIKDGLLEKNVFVRIKKSLMIPVDSSNHTVPLDNTIYIWLLNFHSPIPLGIEGVIEFAKNFDLAFLLKLCEGYHESIFKALCPFLTTTGRDLNKDVHDHIVFTVDKILQKNKYSISMNLLVECSSINSMKCIATYLVRNDAELFTYLHMYNAILRRDSLTKFKFLDMLKGWSDPDILQDDEGKLKVLPRMSKETILARIENYNDDEFENEFEIKGTRVLVQAIRQGAIDIVRYIIDDRGFKLTTNALRKELEKEGCSLFTNSFFLPLEYKTYYNFPHKRIEQYQISRTWEFILLRCVETRGVNHQSLFSALWFSAVQEVNYILLRIMYNIDQVREVFYQLSGQFLESMFGSKLSFDVDYESVSSTVLPIIQECVYNTYHFLKERGVSIRPGHIRSNLCRIMMFDFSNRNLIYRTMISDGFQWATDDTSNLISFVFSLLNEDMESFRSRSKLRLFKGSTSDTNSDQWTRHLNRLHGNFSLRLLKINAIGLLHLIVATLLKNREDCGIASMFSKLQFNIFPLPRRKNWQHTIQFLELFVIHFGRLETIKEFTGRLCNESTEQNDKEFCLQIVQYFRNLESYISVNMISQWDDVEDLCISSISKSIKIHLH